MELLARLAEGGEGGEVGMLGIGEADDGRKAARITPRLVRAAGESGMRTAEGAPEDVVEIVDHLRLFAGR
jgi:hypothetical protein